MIFSNVVISSILAAAATALPHSIRDSSSGGGNVQIVNNLGSDIYLWSTSDESSDMHTLTAGGGTYSEKWQTNPNGGGISIKMSTSTDESRDSVLQFEYTLDSDKLYWDMSSIDMDASSEFVKHGFSAIPSDSSCSKATCEAGDSNCADSYQHPDDVNTLSCSTDAEYVLTLG